MKCAGTGVWQHNRDPQTVDRIIVFSDGAIEGIEQVWYNDIPVTLDSYTVYKGTDAQILDWRVPGADQNEKAAQAGGLKNTAYILATIPINDQFNGRIDVSAVVKGRLIQKYKVNAADPRGYSEDGAKVYSDNPAWCILDFLTAYNGVHLKEEQLNIPSFIEAAAYCDLPLPAEDYRLTGTVTTYHGDVFGYGTKFYEEKWD